MSVITAKQRVRFTVPGIPPSVNHYKMRTRRGVTFVSKEAKMFKSEIGYAVIGAGVNAVEAKTFVVGLKIFLGKKQKGDVDNFCKVCLDGLKEAGVIYSDAAIIKLTVEKFRDLRNPRTEFEVIGL